MTILFSHRGTPATYRHMKGVRLDVKEVERLAGMIQEERVKAAKP